MSSPALHRRTRGHRSGEQLPRGRAALLTLTKEQLADRLTLVMALTEFVDAPKGYVRDLVKLYERYGYPDEVTEPVWWADADVAALLGMFYTDHALIRHAANDLVNYWYQQGVLDKYHDHSACILLPGESPDPGPDDPPPKHEPDGYRCRRMVTPLPMEQWEARPSRQPKERRPHHDPPRRCPKCKGFNNIAVLVRCLDCGHEYVPGEPYTSPDEAKQRAAARGIRVLPANPAAKAARPPRGKARNNPPLAMVPPDPSNPNVTHPEPEPSEPEPVTPTAGPEPSDQMSASGVLGAAAPSLDAPPLYTVHEPESENWGVWDQRGHYRCPCGSRASKPGPSGPVCSRCEKPLWVVGPDGEPKMPEGP